MNALDLAAIYDDLYAAKDYEAEARYLAGLIRRHRADATRLLEVACGTGRFLQALQASFEVEGLDIDPRMVERAAHRLPSVPLHVGDMASFRLPRLFDAICCLFRSIAYVRDRDRLRAAVAAMARHLTPGGVLIIEPFFTPATFHVGTVTLNHALTPEGKVAWMYTGRREGDLGVYDIHYLVGTPRGVQHDVMRHELGLFTRQDFEAAFTEAGLALVLDTDGPSATGLYVGTWT